MTLNEFMKKHLTSEDGSAKKLYWSAKPGNFVVKTTGVSEDEQLA